MAVFSVILNTPAVAHSVAGGIEVGTIFGISRYRHDDGLTTSVGLPGSAYISGFLIEKLSLGAEFAYAKMSFEEDASWWEEDESLTLYAVAVGPRVTFYPYGHSMSGPYFMGQGVFSRFSFTEDETSEAYNNFAAGPGLGCQWRWRQALVLRAEVRYKRWFKHGGGNQMSYSLGLGVRG